MPKPLTTQLFQGLGIFIFVILSLLFAHKPWLPLPWAWLFVIGTLLLLFVVLGHWINKDPLGILINERNLMSLSRFQIVCWSLVIFATYIVFLMQRVGHVPDPLAVKVDNSLWAVLGISTASFVGAPLVLSTKSDRPLSDAAARSAGNALQESPVDIQQNAQGTLYSNAQATDARFSDIFQGDEVGNTAYVDVSKVQMFLITVLLIGAYCSQVWAVLSQNNPDLSKLPAPSQDMLKLFALSHAGYLTFKTVNHTNTTNQ
jgi:hypothetical protein